MTPHFPKDSAARRETALAKRACLVFGMLAATSLPFIVRAEKFEFPRLVNPYYTDAISEQEARELAKWDVLILGFEVWTTSPSAMRLIKQINPSIVILGYSNSILKLANRPATEPNLTRYLGTKDEWLLKSPQGGTMGYWPSTRVVNPTDYTPLVGGKRWNTYLPEFSITQVRAAPVWDGIFFDDGMPDIAWLNNGDIDINYDGVRDSPGFIDDSWRASMKAMYGKARLSAGPGMVMVTNSSNIWSDHTNGRLFESYFVDKGSWLGEVQAVHDAVANGGYTPRYVFVNANTGNTGNWQDWQRFRFAFASTLMTDAYFSYNFGDTWHQQLWWYDEYGLNLGKPLGQAHVVAGASGDPLGVWRRDFEYGAALVNTAPVALTVGLGEQFRKLQGTQDPVVNNGATADRVTIAGYDGVVLARVNAKPAGPSVTSPQPPTRSAWRPARQAFINFSPAEVRSAVDGAYVQALQLRNDALPQQAFGLSDDLDGDGTEETLVWNRGTLTASLSAQQKWKIAPYDATWRGRVAMATGDLDGDGKREIVLTPGKGGGPHVRVVNSQGRVIGGFFAGNAASRGGASLALSDLDSDGKDEIIIGAGIGEEANVMIFDGRGALVYSFNAFALPFRDGIHVAAGDLDGNGTDEIAVGTVSGSPRVRIFDAKGVFLREILAGEGKSTAGARVMWWNVPPYQPRENELLLSTGAALNFSPDKPTLIIVK